MRRCGTLARAPLRIARDFSMPVETIRYCEANGIGRACDGANKGRFAGFPDVWGLPVIQVFAGGTAWERTFPGYHVARGGGSGLDWDQTK